MQNNVVPVDGMTPRVCFAPTCTTFLLLCTIIATQPARRRNTQRNGLQSTHDLPNSMPRSSNTALLAQTLRDLSERVPEWWDQLPQLWMELWHDVMFPVGVGLVAAALVGWILQRVYRWIVPLTAAQLHKEALQALRSAPELVLVSSSSHNKYERQAEQLLLQALQRDPSYEPARLSLAALYLYRQRNPRSAQQVLLNAQPKNDPLVQGILLDAQALLAGQDQMIQTELRAAEFLHVAFANSSLAPKKTTDSPVKEKKKNDKTTLARKKNR